MSMSTYVRGFRAVDKKYNEFKAIWDMCEKNDIEIPTEVGKFFNWRTPDIRGIEVNIEEAINPYTGDMEEGYEVDLTKLPKDLKIIRFYNSY